MCSAFTSIRHYGITGGLWIRVKEAWTCLQAYKQLPLNILQKKYVAQYWINKNNICVYCACVFYMMKCVSFFPCNFRSKKLWTLNILNFAVKFSQIRGLALDLVLSNKQLPSRKQFSLKPFARERGCSPSALNPLSCHDDVHYRIMLFVHD